MAKSVLNSVKTKRALGLGALGATAAGLVAWWGSDSDKAWPAVEDMLRQGSLTSEDDRSDIRKRFTKQYDISKASGPYIRTLPAETTAAIMALYVSVLPASQPYFADGLLGYFMSGERKPGWINFLRFLRSFPPRPALPRSASAFATRYQNQSFISSGQILWDRLDTQIRDIVRSDDEPRATFAAGGYRDAMQALGILYRDPGQTDEGENRIFSDAYTSAFREQERRRPYSGAPNPGITRPALQAGLEAVLRSRSA